MKEFLLAAWYNNPGVITGAVFGALFTAIAVGSAFTAAFKSNPVSADTVRGGVDEIVLEYSEDYIRENMAENITASCNENYLKVSNTESGGESIFEIEDKETMTLVDNIADDDFTEEIPVFYISDEHIEEIEATEGVEIIVKTAVNAEKIQEVCIGENGSGMSVVATILLTTTMGVFGAMGLVLLIALMVAPPDGPSSRQLRRYNYY